MYSASLYYELEEVAVVVFSFNVVRFKIWSYFTALAESKDLWMRFVAYNPLFNTPIITNIFITLNIPPLDCVLTISPS